MTTVDDFFSSPRPKEPAFSIPWLGVDSLFDDIEEQFTEAALFMQAQQTRGTSAAYPNQPPLYDENVFDANPGSPMPSGHLASSTPNTPRRADEHFAAFDTLVSRMYSASQEEVGIVMPPATPTPHHEQAAEAAPESPVAPPYSPVETSAVNVLAAMHSGPTTSIRKRTLKSFATTSETVIAEGSVTTVADADEDADEDSSDDEPLAKRVARGTPKKSGRSRKSYKLPKPVQRLCATDEERERLVAAATWPLHDVNLRGNLLPYAKLLLWAPRPQILTVPEVVGMTMAQHKELAAKGAAATGIPEVVMQYYQRYELRYLLAVPDGQYVTTDANFRIEATMLDLSFFWSCKQGAKRQLLLEKWGGTQQSCSGVFTALSSVARHLYAESQVLARGALEPTLLANLDSTHFTVPGQTPKFDGALGLPRQGRSFRKLIVEVTPAELETSVAKLVALTEDMTCLEQSVPAGASGPIVAVKHFISTASTASGTVAVDAAKKLRAKLATPVAKPAASAQTSSAGASDDIIQQRLLNMQNVVSASTNDDEHLASAMLDPIVSIDEILANKNK